MEKPATATHKVFLGGTCNNSKWREELIPQLTIEHFNPVVENWTPECQQLEIEERETADFVLYTLTPAMLNSPQRGYYSIAEVVDDSNKRPSKTVLCILREYEGEMFSDGSMKALNAVVALVSRNGVYFAPTLADVARYLNSGGVTSAEHAAR